MGQRRRSYPKGLITSCARVIRRHRDVVSVRTQVRRPERAAAASPHHFARTVFHTCRRAGSLGGRVMIFINDLARRHEWLTPAPIGTVEDGWAEIVSDLMLDIGTAVATRPGATVDILTVEERDGDLLFDAVVDGAGEECSKLTGAIERAVGVARIRAGATCARCGKPGRLRLDRPAWPATRCDEHAGLPGGSSRR